MINNSIINKLLYIASSQGYLELVQELIINKQADVNSIDGGSYPIYIAAQYGYKKIVEVLLENNANPDVLSSQGMSPLYVAIINKHYDIVEALLKAGANTELAHTESGATPLYLAIYLDDQVAAKLLLNYGANRDFILNGRSISDIAGEKQLNEILLKIGVEKDKLYQKENAVLKIDNVNISNRVITNQNNNSFYDHLEKTLLNVIMKKDLEVFKALVQQELDLNAFLKVGHGHFTLIHLATIYNFPEAIEILLNKQVDLNARVSFSRDGFDGATALYIAAFYGNEQIIKQLLKAGANTEIAIINNASSQESHHTPLYAAVFNKHINSTKLLLDYHAKVFSDDYVDALQLSSILELNEIHELLEQEYYLTLTKYQSPYLNLSSNRSFEVVVVHFEEPDLSWILAEFPNEKITIYHKGEEELTPLSPNWNIIKIPNVGWDSGTQIYHIISNYNNLADRTLFVQGYTLDSWVHRPQIRYKYEDLYFNCRNIMGKCAAPERIEDISKSLQNRDWKNSKYKCFDYENNNLVEYGKKFITLDLPEKVSPCNSLHYAVDADVIKRNSLEFYQNLYLPIQKKCPIETSYNEALLDLIFDQVPKIGSILTYEQEL